MKEEDKKKRENRKRMMGRKTSRGRMLLIRPASFQIFPRIH